MSLTVDEIIKLIDTVFWCLFWLIVVWGLFK